MKLYRRICSLFLSVAVLFAMPVQSFAANEPYIDDVPYSYELTPASDEWSTYILKSDILDRLQIPEKKLSSMTTEALLTTVLNYPYISDYDLYNTLEDAYKVFCNDFNGFRELMARPDLTAVLVKEYSESDVMTAELYLQYSAVGVEKENENTRMLPKLFFRTSTIEFLLICDELHNGDFSAQEREIITVLVDEKNDARAISGLYSSNSNIYTRYSSVANRAAIGANEYSSGTNQATTEACEYAYVSSVYTPNNSEVETYYDSSPEFTDEEIEEKYLEILDEYPNAEYLRPASVKYNCHSYAWYSQETSNKHWMNDPSLYMSDGSYYRITTSPRVGMKAFWATGNHSGIVSMITYSGGTHSYYITSKWGRYGLYEHLPTNCPYSGTIRFYTRSGS